MELFNSKEYEVDLVSQLKVQVPVQCVLRMSIFGVTENEIVLVLVPSGQARMSPRGTSA